MMTEEQHLANALTAFIGRPLDNPLTRSEIMETARIALAALTQTACASENIRHDALCDTNYARGVAHGWNLAQNGDSEGMRKCIESRTTAAMSALAQSASPALRLPDGWVAVPMEPTPGMMVAGTLVSEFQEDPSGMYRAMVAEAPAVPRTAPIEPICATGGWQDPLLHPAIIALKNGEIHAPEVLDIFDAMAREIQVHRDYKRWDYVPKCATGGAEWVSNDRVEEIIYRAEMFGHGAGYLPDEVIPMAKELLALRKAFSEPYGWITEYPSIPAGIGGMTYSFHDNRQDAQDEAEAYDGFAVAVIRKP